MTRDQRRQLHLSVNALSHYTVGSIVKQHFPGASPQEINKIAKQVINKAHDLISPKQRAKAVKHE